MKIRIALVMALSIVLGAAPSGAAPAQLTTDMVRYRSGEIVNISVKNTGARSLHVRSPIEVIDRADGTVVAAYRFSEVKRLRPGRTFTWAWDQWRGTCSGDCSRPDVSPPDLVDPARYKVRVETSGGTFSQPFSIGEFFTLGFEGRDVTFSLFTHIPEVIDQLRAEAEAEDKTLIVSGVVRRGKHRYNPDWSFHMGPGSIVTGEVFMEVCDASPEYVEENLDDWKGQQWCPWSSYVQSAGRP
ncbi:MAG: hypothetical protein ACLGHL_03320 [Actinomycetota bacterium]